jgi:hypothetical protein
VFTAQGRASTVERAIAGAITDRLGQMLLQANDPEAITLPNSSMSPAGIESEVVWQQELASRCFPQRELQEWPAFSCPESVRRVS